MIRRRRLALLAVSGLFVASGALAPVLAADPDWESDDPNMPSEPTRPAEPTTKPPPATTPAASARDTAIAKVRRGQELATQGRRDEAMEALREALEAYPAYPLAHHELGVVMADAGNLVQAEANLRRALDLAPDFQRAHQALAEVLRRGKRFDEALDHYARALRQDASDTAAWYGLAASLRATKKPAEGLWALERLVAAAPDKQAALAVEARKAADAALAAGTTPKPWKGLDATAEAAPAPATLPRHAGDDAFERQTYLPALAAYLEQAKTPAGEKDAVLAYKVGAVYAIMNESRQAIAWWRKSLALDPGRELVGRHLALLIARQREAEAAAGGVTSGDAIARARDALLTGDPATALWLVEGTSAPEAAVLAGEARLQLGDFIGARPIFEALLAKNPEDRVARGGLAEALLRGPQTARTTALGQKTLQEWLGDDEARVDTFLVLRRAEVDARVLMPAPSEDEE